MACLSRRSEFGKQLRIHLKTQSAKGAKNVEEDGSSDCGHMRGSCSSGVRGVVTASHKCVRYVLRSCSSKNVC